MAAIQFPPYDSPPTDPNDYLVTPFEAPNGSKWTWGGDAKPRWTAWAEPPLTEIAWGEVTGKPTTFAPSAHTHDDRYYTESEIDTALSGKQATGDYATNTALNSGLAGKAPASGISPSAITGTAVVTDDSRLSDARTPTAHTHAASEITGTAVVLSGAQTITGSKTFSSLTTNGTVVFGAGSTFFADTAAANSARSALGVARGIETVGSSQAAVVGGRYITTAAVTITDPTTRIDGSALQDGDSYEVWIGGPGNATIDGVAYVPSRFSIRRARISGAWTTPAATVTGAFNATTIGANTPGTAAFTTLTASGTTTLGVTNGSGTPLQVNGDIIFGRAGSLGRMYRSGSLILFDSNISLGTGSLTVGNVTASGTLAVTGATTLTGGYLLGELTVATLPTASSNTRRRYEVTDALSPALGATVAAGGSARCTVRSNGTNWIVIQLL